MEQQGTWFGASGAMGVSGTALLKHLHTGFLQDSWGLAAPWLTARLQKQLLHLLYWKGQRVCADTTVLVSKKKTNKNQTTQKKSPTLCQQKAWGWTWPGPSSLAFKLLAPAPSWPRTEPRHGCEKQEPGTELAALCVAVQLITITSSLSLRQSNTPFRRPG